MPSPPAFGGIRGPPGPLFETQSTPTAKVSHYIAITFHCQYQFAYVLDLLELQCSARHAAPRQFRVTDVNGDRSCAGAASASYASCALVLYIFVDTADWGAHRPRPTGSQAHIQRLPRQGRLVPLCVTRIPTSQSPSPLAMAIPCAGTAALRELRLYLLLVSIAQRFDGRASQVHESNGLHLPCGERALIVVQYVHRLDNSSLMLGRMHGHVLLSLLLTRFGLCLTSSHCGVLLRRRAVTARQRATHHGTAVLRGDLVRPHEWGGRRAAACCQGWVVSAIAAALND